MNLKNSVLISTVCFAVMHTVAGPAQAGWQSFRAGDGLAHDYVLVVLEDSSENLWFGTSDGATRYDGVEWTTYRESDGLAGNVVMAMCEDRSGGLWFGTNGGASRLDGSCWTTYTEADGLALNWVTTVLEDASGGLWFGTIYRGVFRFDGEIWTNYTEIDGLAGEEVRAIIEDSSGNLWFGTSGGVSRYDGKDWITYTESDGLADDYVWAIFEDKFGALWFGTNSDGLSRYDGVYWSTYTEADGLTDNFVRAIAGDRLGRLWVGTVFGGVASFDGKRWLSYAEELGIFKESVRAIAEDNAGNMWFGTNLGASRYDGVSWRVYTQAEGLAQDYVKAILEDSSGNLWFGGAGVSHYDGASWTTYTEADGLAGNWASAIIEDSSGDLWFGGAGVSRYDGVSWTTYTEADGLAKDSIQAILEESSGDMWFGTYGAGVSRFDGTNWTTYTKADGLADDTVWAIVEDESGILWFGTNNGVSSYDGLSWVTYAEPDGPAGRQCFAIIEDGSGAIWFGTHDGGVTRYDGSTWTTYSEIGIHVVAIHEDRLGNFWFGTYGGGVIRYDGETWTTYTSADGLPIDWVEAVYQTSSGVYWFGTSLGVAEYEPDRVPPQAVIWPKPPRLSPNTVQNIGFVAAFGESQSIEFSYSLDESPWSPWSAVSSWTTTGLDDGEHMFRARARDFFRNVDLTPAEYRFEIDATPPSAVVSSPAFGQAVKDSIEIIGTAADLRFSEYVLECRRLKSELWESLEGSSNQITDGMLGGWNTIAVPDGDYELRLSVTDTLGLTGTAIVGVVVDNGAPWAWETTPVVIKSETGGDVYTTDREAHLYFPPNAFSKDTEIRINELRMTDAPDTLADGADRVLVGFEIAWEDIVLAKPGTLELSYECLESDRDPGSGAYFDETTFAIYMMGSDSQWRRLGGTLDKEGRSISTSLTEPGLYSVFAGGQITGGGTALSVLSITPRVFSPSGGFASSRAGIGFTLGRPGPVTVKIYNRAGRLVREVISGEKLTAGRNLVHWDGRGRDGNLVEDGFYLVTVEALGQKQVKPLAVVR